MTERIVRREAGIKFKASEITSANCIMANGATAFPDIFSCLLSMLTQQTRSTEIKDYCQKSSVNISLLGEHIFAEAICGKSVNQ